MQEKSKLFFILNKCIFIWWNGINLLSLYCHYGLSGWNAQHLEVDSNLPYIIILY